MSFPFRLYCRVTGVTFSRKSNPKASDTSLRTNPCSAQIRRKAGFGLRDCGSPSGCPRSSVCKRPLRRLPIFLNGEARPAPNNHCLGFPLFVDLLRVPPDPFKKRAGDLSCAPSVAVVSGLQMAVLSPCVRGLGSCALWIVCTRNRPPHQSASRQLLLKEKPVRRLAFLSVVDWLWRKGALLVGFSSRRRREDGKAGCSQSVQPGPPKADWGALQNGHEKNNEGREPKGYPTLVVCFRMNV